MASATGQYDFLWGFYVRGFKPWHHCFKCLYGTHEKAINRDMKDGVVLLPEPTGYFYLCGVASGKRSERGKNNLHLAVRPKARASATVKSVYGPTFTVVGGEEVVIQEPFSITEDLPEGYARCKNFRFAAQVYPASRLGPGADHEIIKTGFDV